MGVGATPVEAGLQALLRGSEEGEAACRPTRHDADLGNGVVLWHECAHQCVASLSTKKSICSEYVCITARHTADPQVPTQQDHTQRSQHNIHSHTKHCLQHRSITEAADQQEPLLSTPHGYYSSQKVRYTAMLITL